MSTVEVLKGSKVADARTEVQQESNKDGGGQGQWSAWKVSGSSHRFSIWRRTARLHFARVPVARPIEQSGLTFPGGQAVQGVREGWWRL